MHVVQESLQTLQDRKVDLKELQQDDRFIDVVLHASQVALRNSAATKREALRNAIVNAGLSSSPGDAQQQMFVAWIDELTVWHLRVLAFLNNPRERLHERQLDERSVHKRTPGGLIDLYFHAELANDSEFAQQLFRDLENRGLVKESFSTKLPHALALDRRTSKIGAKFLAFISEN